MFIGRSLELEKLNELYQYKGSKIAVLYGRRRVGKSFLIEHFVKNKVVLKFEGIENEATPNQIKYFTHDLAKQIEDPLLKKVLFTKWEDIFDYLSVYLKKRDKKTIIFLDELQWLAANHGTLISLLKKYWDTEWKNLNIFLILCGSVSSYMVKKVIKSKALYGRIDCEISLEALSPSESLRLIKSTRSRDELFKYLMVLGGVPKYLERINTKKSFEQNMNQLFFVKDAIFVNEYEKVFFSQFKEHRTYEKIVNFLAESPKNLKEVAQCLKLPSGGGVKYYLVNLQRANFITSYAPFTKSEKTNLVKYKLSDEYLRFFFKYIRPNAKLISHNKENDLFVRLTQNSFEKWLGFAFENFCLKNAMLLAKIMRFEKYVLSFGPHFERGDDHFQVDLLYYRSDNTVTLCEIKFYNKLIETKVIPEVERKCALIKIPRGFTLEKALISLYGPTPSLQDTQYFHHYVKLDDFFK